MQTLNGLGYHTQAIQYYDKALAIDPKYVDALSGKGNALNDLGNYTGAEFIPRQSFSYRSL